jgi:hypothetical protein
VRSAAGIGAASLRQPRYYGWARRVVACLRRFFARGMFESSRGNVRTKSAAELRTGIPTHLSLPWLSFAELACFSRKDEENEERANG